MIANKHRQAATVNLQRQTGKGPVLAAVLLLIIAAGVAWLAHAAQQPEQTFATAQANAEGPTIPPAKGDQCVADTALMRTDHMDLLNHQRDETVLKGIRDQPFSLVACVNCHAQTSVDGTPIRIDAEGQFCQSCHQYAAVKIDCFSCHAALPEKASHSLGQAPAPPLPFKPFGNNDDHVANN